jgi:hypothetical protein
MNKAFNVIEALKADRSKDDWPFDFVLEPVREVAGDSKSSLCPIPILCRFTQLVRLSVCSTESSAHYHPAVETPMER